MSGTAIEEELGRLVEKEFCLFAGRGATALWATYSIVPENRRKILVPDIVCLSPIYTAIYAGLTPVFIDVKRETGLMDLDLVLEKIRQDDEIGAILGVHLYGNVLDLKRLQAVSKEKDIMLIEDAAQAFGGFYSDGAPVGSRGDVSILSFGNNKILEAGGGGAVLLNDPVRADKIRRKLSGVSEVDTSKLSKLYSKLYYDIQEGIGISEEFRSLFFSFPGLFRNLYFKNINEKILSTLTERLAGFRNEIERRIQCRNTYVECLKENPGIHIPEYQERAVPWRFVFRMNPCYRDELLSAIRKGGFDASSWYPPVHSLLPDGYETILNGCPASEEFSKMVVNLWVTPEYDKERIQSLCGLINGVLK